MTSDDQPMALTFRCPRELEGLLPPPTPAIEGLPDWLRSMPQQAFSGLAGGPDDTVKRCPPFIDAMTSGFLIPLICDVRVKNGEFTWDSDLPTGGSVAFAHSPLGFHDPGQASGAPWHDADRFMIKFHNLWTIQAPPGFSVLFTHPANRGDLPFTTLTGLVDCDRYHDNWINFPALWRDPDFEGVLPRGTPVAQCYPVRRQTWVAQTLPFTEEEARRAEDLQAAILQEKGVYRRTYRA